MSSAAARENKHKVRWFVIACTKDCRILFLISQPFHYPPCFLAQPRKGCWKSCWPHSAHCRHGIWHTNGSIVSGPKATEEWNIADFNWIVVLANEKESSVIYSLVLGRGGGKQTTKPKNYYICFFNHLQNKKEKWVVWYWFYNIKRNNSLQFLEP